jgi:hypothetical protein
MPQVTGLEAFEKDQMRWQVANLSACHDLESGLRPGVYAGVPPRFVVAHQASCLVGQIVGT